MTTCPMCHDPLDDHQSTVVGDREVLECSSIPSSSRETARRYIAEMRRQIAQARGDAA